MRPIPAAVGGRRAAEIRLAAIDPARYGATRNHLEGAVTHLSPYIRHGVLTLAEVRDTVFTWLECHGYGPTPERRAEGRRIAGKLINELGWRDYWQRLWLHLGDGIWHDLEPLKTGHPAATYAPELPPDVGAADTGLACIDAFATELVATGWLHNHARMWLAAYVVHWRRVRWQAGARWFLHHLLDGDPASNNLSWQWVASSFSNKPYIFNRANLERFSAGRHCRRCAAAAAGTCPFEGSYEALQERLFQPSPDNGGSALSRRLAAPAADAGTASPRQLSPRQPVLWIHDEALGPANPALRAHPGRPALVVLEPPPDATRKHPDSGSLELSLSDNRLRFLKECAAELPVEQRQGFVPEALLAFARARGADAIVTSRGVHPRFRAIAAALEALQQHEPPSRRLPLISLDPDPFVELPDAVDLGRFSRYWRRAEPRVWASWRQEST